MPESMDAKRKTAEAQRLNQARQYEATLELLGSEIEPNAPEELVREWAAAILELERTDLTNIELVLTTLQDWATIEPDNMRAAYYVAKCLYFLGDAPSAEIMLAPLLESKPTYDAALLCSNAQLVQGKTELAAETLKRAAPRIQEPLAQEALMSRYYLFSEQYEEAAAAAQRGLAHDPNNLICLMTLSEANYEFGEREQGMRYLQEAVAANPTNRDARGKLILQLLMDGNVDAAEEVLTSGPLNEDEQHDLLLELGEELNDMGLPEVALLAYERAAMRFPDSYFALNGLGTTLQYVERDEEALLVFDRAITLDATLPHAWLGRGLALYDLERNLDGLHALNRSLELMDADRDPQNISEYNLLRAEAYYGQALIHYEMGREHEAIGLMETVLTLNPDHPEAADVLAEWQSGGDFL
jgi:tetratricopeptide (TPR) repeat protein